MLRVSRFYGWSLDEVRELDIQDIHFADMAITQLDAQERIVEARIALLSVTKPKQIDKFLKALNKQAYPAADKKSLSAEQFKEMLNG